MQVIQKIIVANWKLNKNLEEIKDWFKEISKKVQPINTKIKNHLEIIISPSCPYLPVVESFIKKYKLPFKTSAQNVSEYKKEVLQEK